MNDEMPNLKQTELERFWLSLSAIKEYNAKYLSTSGKKVVRAPIGTDAWEDHILSKVLAPQDQKRGFGALLKMPRAWDFVNLAGQLSYMRDGKHLKMDALKKRLCPVTKAQSVTKTVTDSRTKQPVSVRPHDTAGGVRLRLFFSLSFARDDVHMLIGKFVVARRRSGSTCSRAWSRRWCSSRRAATGLRRRRRACKTTSSTSSTRRSSARRRSRGTSSCRTRTRTRRS